MITKGPISKEMDFVEAETQEQISIYPNPAYSVININLPDNDNAEFCIYNMSGTIVHRAKIENNLETIDISNLQNGMYIIHIITADENYTEKIIKK